MLPSPEGRPTAALSLLVVTTVVVGVYLACQRALGSPELAQALATRPAFRAAPASSASEDAAEGGT
jgi:hypothetical protein